MPFHNLHNIYFQDSVSERQHLVSLHDLPSRGDGCQFTCSGHCKYNNESLITFTRFHLVSSKAYFNISIRYGIKTMFVSCKAMKSILRL